MLINIKSQKGSMALEHIMFIAAAIFVMSTGLTVFLTYLDSYYCNFNDSEEALEKCQQRRQ